MEHSFWHERWESNNIAFHEGEPNALLTSHFGDLAIPAAGRVFVPLCGKSRDIHWLLNEGYRVAGAELSELAVRQLFEELGAEPAIAETGSLKHFAAPGIDVFAGDIFALTREMLGDVDAVYDRAALVALPEAMRRQYTAHLRQLCGSAPQLLITLEYKKDLISGPPFSVGADEVRVHYGATHTICECDNRFSPTGLRGQFPVTERAWILSVA